jgi:hypothetical protein
MGVVGRLDQYASMLAGEFDDYSMSENLMTSSQLSATTILNDSGAVTLSTDTTVLSPYGLFEGVLKCVHTTNTGGYFRRGQVLSLTAATTYTFSVFFKNGTVASPYGQNNVFPGPSLAANTFSPSFEEFVTSLKTTIPYPNGWYRQVITFTPTYSSTYNVFFNQAVNQSPIGTYYLYGFQLEVGSTATDYTPTTTTAKTRVLSSTTNTNITGLGTYYSSGFDENIGFTTFLPANISPPYDPVYDEFGGTLFGAGQGRYMRQYTDKSVIVYNEIDEVTDFRDIVRTGLVLDLDAAQPLSYKGTGTSWNDLSGTGNNGTLVNTPTYDTSGYFNFDYTQSESVSFSSSSSIQFLNRSAYTLEAWVYPTRNPGAANYTGIFDREDTSTGSRDGYNIFFLGSATTDTYFYTERFVAGVNGFTFITLNQSVSVNNWSHIVATYDGTTLTLYRNGSSVGTPATTTGNITNTSKTLTVGVRGGNYFGGRIANAKIYNRALTATEITQNYNALKHRFGL